MKSTSTSRKEGTVLFLAIAIILALSSIAFTTYSMMLTEITINDNQVNTTKALYDADAAIKFTKREIETRLESGTSLETVLENLNVTPPQGFNFDPINDFEVIVPERLFRFSATGRSGKASTTVNAALRRSSATEVGIFGENQVYMMPNSTAYAYDSRIDPDPESSQIAGGSSVGSNGYIDFRSNAYLDGSLLLGENENGSTASCSGCSDYNQTEVGRIDSDPLGIVGGSLEAEMSALSTDNDNDNSSFIENEKLRLNANETATLTAGDYYLESLELKPKSTLNIDSSDGPVRIFVEDFARVWPKANINNGGTALDLQIFSPTTADIKMLPKSDFTGLLYAPRADILAMPNGNFNGAVWGNNAYIKPGGTVYVDVAVLDRLLLNRLIITQWKEVRSE